VILRSIRLYTVHARPGTSPTTLPPVFVKEGFNFSAFLFHFFWALYQRLWLPALLIFLVNALLVLLVRWHWVGEGGLTVLQLGFQFLVGAHGNDWVRARLSREGYILADITAGDSGLRAEQRYFERFLAA
jgi:hypothetical protein